MYQEQEEQKSKAKLHQERLATYYVVCHSSGPVSPVPCPPCRITPAFSAREYHELAKYLQMDHDEVRNCSRRSKTEARVIGPVTAPWPTSIALRHVRWWPQTSSKKVQDRNTMDDRKIHMAAISPYIRCDKDFSDTAVPRSHVGGKGPSIGKRARDVLEQLTVGECDRPVAVTEIKGM